MVLQHIGKEQSGEEHKFRGSHLLATYLNCDPAMLCDAERCLRALTDAAQASGVTVVGKRVHSFPNGGLTAILLLAESHASIHTYPEYRSCFVDFFTCGDSDVTEFDKMLRVHLKPAEAKVQVVER